MVEKNIVKLVCEDCGGTMDIDSNKEIMMCPFCGSKKIILESDEVKIAKANVEKQRINKDIEQIKFDKEKYNNKNELIYGVVGFIMLIIVWFLTKIL